MRFFVMCFFSFCVNTVFANGLNNEPTPFDIKQANQTFDRINLQLSVQNLNLTNLQDAVSTLTTLTGKSEQYIEAVQKKINSTELLMKQNTGSVDNKNVGADLVYLNNQKKVFEEEQAQCRLFNIRAKEAISAYKTAIEQLKQTATLTRGMPIWKLINQVLTAPPEVKLQNVLDSDVLGSLPPLLYCVFFALFSWGIATIILSKLRNSRFAPHYLRLKELHHRNYKLLLSAFLFSMALFADQLIASDNLFLFNLPLMLSVLLLVYLLSLLALTFLFSTKQSSLFFFRYSLDKSFFQRLFMTLLSFYALFLVGQLFSSSFNIHSPLWQLIQSTFILLSLGTTAYFIYLFCRIHQHLPPIKYHRKLILRLSTFSLLSCAVIEILGYYTLAQQLALSSFLTLMIISITLLFTHAITIGYLFLHQKKSIETKMIRYFGYKKDQSFTEFLILKTVAQLLVVLVGFYLIGESWGVSSIDLIESIYDQLLHGVHIAQTTVYPTRVISGIVIFCLLYLLSRSISTAISNHQQFEEEEETQVAVASILTYIGFSLALIIGLLVAGFDFTGLAIIAGALSVGIGLGLQSIVNNFVSGLILLIEKPIRPGDRINVDGVEGFVKKIRVRSTQIMTSAREDIIVPNSDLITRRVTNYMFSDKFYHISCEVGVAYGSDTQLVREILLTIANHHDEVVKSSRNKPVVLFRSFADDALIFQLGCLIKDVNKKSLVRSDLNFAIEAAFREHHIDMPFQQRNPSLKLGDLAVLAQKLREAP